MTTFTREDFEHAAKAAGIEYDADHAKRRGDKVAMFGLWLKTKGEPYEGQRRHWNPPEDDGDALRLAVKLRIKFRYNEALGQALAWTGGVLDFEARANIEDFGRDENAAARCAIFRAAIAIGRAMS